MGASRRASAGAAAIATGLLIAAAFALVSGFAIFLKGWKSVPVDKVALHYSGGPLEGEHFVSVVSPGTRTRFYGLFDRLYELPATQGNYIMSKAPDQNAAGKAEYVGAPAADRVMTEWESATYFKLNTRPEAVRRFFEQICLKYDCTDLSRGGGWERMLADTFRQQIVAAIQEEARRYSSEQIYADRDTLLAMQAAIGSSLKERVSQVLGGEFFCGPAFRPEVPDCPQFAFVIKELTLPANVRDRYNANRAALLAVDEAKAEAQSQAALRAAPDLTPSQIAYVRAQAELECARRPACVLVVGGEGQVEVNAGRTGQ